MRWMILVLWCAVAAGETATSQPATTLSDQYVESARELANEFAPTLSRVRYMESKEPREVTIPGWEGFPTRRHSYSVKDKDGMAKHADVVMLNPSVEQIARWIVQALVEVKGKYGPVDGRKIFKHIIGQSGGQFPVAGVVYEDILPADGKMEAYCFRDGVTVEVDGVTHRTTAPLTDEEMEKSLNGTVKRVFTYARIQSTSPQQWIVSGGSKEVLKDGKPTLKWLDEVRNAYQRAWKSDRNELLVAWVKGSAK